MALPTTTAAGDKEQQQQQQQQQDSITQQGDNASRGAGVNSGAGTTRAKTQAEEDADRLYEERMEDEYAKREGGA